MPELDWSIVPRSMPLLLEATVLTLQLFGAALLLSTALGLAVALMKLSAVRVLRWFATGYIWFFRGTPNLVIMFFAFFWVGRELGLTPLQSGILGLGVDAGAYKAEIIRSGFLAVDPGQDEAARALGMTRAHSIRRVILPQAVRVIVPTYMSNAILVLKATSLAAVIGLTELTGISRQLSNSTFQPIELLTAAAGIYLVLTTVLVVLQEFLERRVALKV